MVLDAEDKISKIVTFLPLWSLQSDGRDGVKQDNHINDCLIKTYERNRHEIRGYIVKHFDLD